MSNAAALGYAQSALNDVPSRTTISTDQEKALKNLADGVENLARAVIELARRQG